MFHGDVFLVVNYDVVCACTSFFCLHRTLLAPRALPCALAYKLDVAYKKKVAGDGLDSYGPLVIGPSWLGRLWLGHLWTDYRLHPVLRLLLTYVGHSVRPSPGMIGACSCS